MNFGGLQLYQNRQFTILKPTIQHVWSGQGWSYTDMYGQVCPKNACLVGIWSVYCRIRPYLIQAGYSYLDSTLSNYWFHTPLQYQAASGASQAHLRNALGKGLTENREIRMYAKIKQKLLRTLGPRNHLFVRNCDCSAAGKLKKIGKKCANKNQNPLKWQNKYICTQGCVRVQLKLRPDGDGTVLLSQGFRTGRQNHYTTHIHGEAGKGKGIYMSTGSLFLPRNPQRRVAT